MSKQTHAHHNLARAHVVVAGKEGRAGSATENELLTPHSLTDIANRVFTTTITTVADDGGVGVGACAI